MNVLSTYRLFFTRAIPIEPLVTFRILFGGLMMLGALRFMQKGWIERLYVEPKFFFKFYNFEWIEPFNAVGMYIVYAIIAVSAALVMLGLWYRIAIVVFFLAFTYTELIDVTNYLNHYYLVCWLALLLCFLPAHRAFSLDVWRNKILQCTHVPAYCIYLLCFQVGLVYFFAGWAKLNHDWLFRAMPLAVWLPTKADFLLLGWFFKQPIIAFIFSWFAALYDLTIPFFLLYAPSRPLAYTAVVVFHALTKMLFNIGLFPWIMISSTLIFFSSTFHQRFLGRLGYQQLGVPSHYQFPKFIRQTLLVPILIYIIFQLLFPLRYLLYSGKVEWTEQGYRFAWRVMLIEKNGSAIFTVKDTATNRVSEVINSHYLTTFQEKQMAIQPDLILQFAHHLADVYKTKYNFQSPIVTVDCQVALNGRISETLIDPNTNLAAQKDGWKQKSWILIPNSKLDKHQIE